MARKALILDLDNTIYPVAPYAGEMFATFMQLVTDSGEQQDNIEGIRKDIMRRGFLIVAATYNFSKQLKQKGNDLFKELTYAGQLEPYEDFRLVRDLPHEKFLVTAGYQKFQQSKIALLKLEKYFKEIHIVDVTTTSLTKKDVFAGIIDRYRYNLSEVLVIGDDLESEISAGNDLGIDTVVYDKAGFNSGRSVSSLITDYRGLNDFL